MHKTIIFIALLASAIFAQNTVTIQHKKYTTIYDTMKHYPVMVSWWVDKTMIYCPNKFNRVKFSPDPLLKCQTDVNGDYVRSGYDRGHNMPADDNECDSIATKECFYFSNIAPQAPHLNRGPWERLEDYTRNKVKDYDSVHVWCGSFGQIKKVKNLTIPQYCWKILFIKKLNIFEAYIFSNDSLAQPWTWPLEKIDPSDIAIRGFISDKEKLLCK